MELNNHDQARIREYLLGKLSDDEEQRIEERLMVEDALFDEFEVSKGEIIEDYLAGELSRREKEWFEQHFLVSSEGKQRHTLAFALEKLRRSSPKPRPVTLFDQIQAFFSKTLPKQATVALLLLIAGGAVMFTRVGQQPTFVVITLTSGNPSRSGGPEPARLPFQSNVEEVRFSLELPNSTPSAAAYSAELDDTNQIVPVKVSSHDSKSVLVVVPAAQLPRGQYALKLFATTPDQQKQLVGTYFFDIE